MPYRVVMELVPRPDDTPDWVWNETNLGVITYKVVEVYYND